MWLGGFSIKTIAPGWVIIKDNRLLNIGQHRQRHPEPTHPWTFVSFWTPGVWMCLLYFREVEGLVCFKLWGTASCCRLDGETGRCHARGQGFHFGSSGSDCRLERCDCLRLLKPGWLGGGHGMWTAKGVGTHNHMSIEPVMWSVLFLYVNRFQGLIILPWPFAVWLVDLTCHWKVFCKFPWLIFCFFHMLWCALTIYFRMFQWTMMHMCPWTEWFSTTLRTCDQFKGQFVLMGWDCMCMHLFREQATHVSILGIYIIYGMILYFVFR